VEHSPFLKKIATYQSVSQSVSVCVCEIVKLIRGDPPKIDFKKKGEPPKNNHLEHFIEHTVLKNGHLILEHTS
jgi:hypothetical protein